MTSHQNEERWWRHYSCSQNFCPVALFGTKHPHSRSDVRYFLKAELKKQLWAHCYRHTKQVPSQPQFLFWQAVYKVCKPAVFTQFQPSTQWKWWSGDWQESESVSVILSEPSLFEGCSNFLIAKYFTLQEEKWVHGYRVVWHGAMWLKVSAKLTTVHREHHLYWCLNWPCSFSFR